MPRTAKPKPLTPAQFKKLPRAVQRVKIAEDVIASIVGKKLIAERTTYVESYDAARFNKRLCKLPVASPAGKKAIASLHCHVCAKGALFVSTLMATNNATVAQTLNPAYFGGNEGTNAGLTKRMTQDRLWSSRQLDLMEAAFEGELILSSRLYRKKNKTESDKLDITDAQDFFANDLDDYTAEERLVALMLNVINNKGTFIPQQRIDREAVFLTLNPKVNPCNPAKK
jgi:hypothetical protein